MRSTSDPVPFLLAIVASAIGPLTQPGTRAWLNCIVGITIFVVLAVFTWPRRPRTAAAELPTGPVLAAQSIAYGFISAMSAAYFVQRDIEARSTRPSCNPPPPTGVANNDLRDYIASLKCQSDATEELVKSAATSSIWIGLVVGGGMFVALLATTRWLRRESANVHESTGPEM
jgi:hypothetical protein